jgi:hypothetical protein
VECPGEELLARPALAEQQHRRLAVGDAPQQLEGLAQGRAAPHDVVEAVLRPHLLLELPVLAQQPAVLDALLDQGRDGGEVLVALVDVPERPLAQRLDAPLRGPVAGDDDADRVRVALPGSPYQLDPVHSGQAQVGQQHVEVGVLDHLERGVREVHRLDGVALLRQEATERVAKDRVVIDDEDRPSSCHEPPCRDGA